MSTLTIRIPESLRKELRALCKEKHTNASDVVRESLRRYLAVQKFRVLRRKTIPYFRAQGLLTDEDVFNAVS
jgi:Arc/MetJ-type ribon-helix-helix transcriptional regulator